MTNILDIYMFNEACPNIGNWKQLQSKPLCWKNLRVRMNRQAYDSFRCNHHVLHSKRRHAEFYFASWLRFITFTLECALVQYLQVVLRASTSHTSRWLPPMPESTHAAHTATWTVISTF